MTTLSWSFKKPYINNEVAVRGNTVTRRSLLFSISVRFHLPLQACARTGLPAPAGSPPECSQGRDLSTTQILVACSLFPTSVLPLCWQKRQRQVQVPIPLHGKNLNSAGWGCSDSETKCSSRNRIMCLVGENTENFMQAI